MRSDQIDIRIDYNIDKISTIEKESSTHST